MNRFMNRFMNRLMNRLMNSLMNRFMNRLLKQLSSMPKFVKRRTWLEQSLYTGQFTGWGQGGKFIEKIHV